VLEQSKQEAMMQENQSNIAKKDLKHTSSVVNNIAN
jgi:hypothetical protein